MACAAGPSGNEYAIGDRPLPPKQWWTSCTDAAGRRAAISVDCSDSQCDKPGDLFLRRYEASGKAIGARVLLNDTPAWRAGFRVVCSDTGWVAAQWTENGCWKAKAVDPAGRVQGQARLASTVDCRLRPNLAIDDSGRIVATWAEFVPSQGTGILARAFRNDGSAVSAPVAISEGAAGWRLQPKVALDGAGNALIAWIGDEGSGYDGGPVMARFIDMLAAPQSAAFRVDSFGFGINRDPALRRVSGGVFEAAWTNALEGGRVAREVRKTGSTAAVAALASTAPALPRFGTPRVVDASPGPDDRHATLATGAGTAVMVAAPPGLLLRSSDESASWQGPVETGIVGETRRFVGGNASGVWIAGGADAGGTLHLARSSDNGSTWSALATVLASPAPGEIIAARVVGAGNIWVIAWTVRTAGDSPRGRFTFSRSTNGGVAWTSPQTISIGDDVGANGFELAANADGTWIAMLADTGVRFVRSTDDGATWKALAPTVSDAACVGCAAAARFGKIALAVDGDRSLAAFPAYLLQQETWGRDGDVFLMLSSNDGAAWTAPAPVSPRAGADGSPDFDPTLATDGNGRWLLAWTTHDPASENDTLDADVVLAASADEGATWTTPALLDARMADDADHDRGVSLARSAAGHWLALWQSQPLAVVDGNGSNQLRMATADAVCGNARVDVGESCDDGNTVDDDGCDHDCTRSGCGNGIVNAGEACDDADRDQHARCLQDCRLPFCGDGTVSAGEECDDGNSENRDACSNACGKSGCGDGIVQTGVEDCDDYGGSTVTCTPECRRPSCGDGYVAPYAEACDDGNAVDDDACPNDCSKATCGDGLRSLGWEECDPKNPFDAEQCSANCRLASLCGDANVDGAVTTSDARIVLKKAVGLTVDCPRAVCDLDDNGRISASDAHNDLRKAVGLSINGKCSVGTGTIVFWTEIDTALAAFQIEIDYSSTGGAFEGTGSAVACWTPETADPEHLAAFKDDDATRTLTVGIVDTKPIAGIRELFRCRFAMSDERPDARLAIRVMDACDVEGNRVRPLPLVGYRVE